MGKNFLFKGISVLGAVLLFATSVMPGLQYAFAEKVTADLDWDYIYDVTSWEAAYNADDSVLKMYYQDYPYEDLYCTDHASSYYDKVYSVEICEDSNCETSTPGTLTPDTWGSPYQIVSDGTTLYRLALDVEPRNEPYVLYNKELSDLCVGDVPEGAYFPQVGDHTWEEKDWGCAYAVDFTSDVCDLDHLPEGAPNNATLPNIEGWNVAPNCTYSVELQQPSTDPIPSGKYVKILSYSYPECVVSGEGRYAKADAYDEGAWAAVHFPYAYNGRISASYGDGDSVYVDAGHARDIKEGKYFIFHIPKSFGADLDVSTFDTTQLKIELYPECGEGTHLEGTACVENTKAVACDNPDPVDPNATYTETENVTWDETWPEETPICTIASCVAGLDNDNEVVEDISGYTLDACPEGGICDEVTPYTKEENACTAGAKKYKLNSCAANYTKDGDTCVSIYTPTGDAVVPQEGTTAQAQTSAVAIPDMTAIQMVSSEDEIVGTGTVVLQETKGDAALAEIAEDESSTSTKATVQAEIISELNNIVAQTDTTKTADMKGIVDIQFIQVSSTGDKSDLKEKVNFNKPVAIKISVPAGINSVKVRVKHTGENSYGTSGLTKNEDNLATCNAGAVDAAHQYDGGDVAVNNNIAVIYTCSASSFVAYAEVAKTTPSTSGGGGGGSSSYSCKNLPANAVANNKTTPKSNTNYSYDTDTSKVCTFQCKSGYAWNEKDAKCEKSDSTDTVDSTNADNTDNVDNTDGTQNDDAARAEADAQALAAGYGQEFIDAYNWAYANGITTMPNINSAQMDQPLTRIAMAKMLSQYAINVLGKTPDTSKVVPNFSDVDAKLDADYNNGVTLAYQLGIMGIGIDKFRPFDLVTRAEFGTALSRMLYGLADGEGDLWYKTHLDKLMNEKIITNDNPQLQELRGYVMIMLMRSAQ